MGIESKYYEPKVEENIDTEIEYLFIAQKKFKMRKFLIVYIYLLILAL